MPHTILIVDDENNLRKTLSRILEKANFNVLSSPNGKQALKIIAEEKVDLAFIDLMMPGMSGIELLSNIREINPRLPVLILTGNATLETAINAVKEGARDYLLKPANPDLIITRIKEILAEQEQPERQRELISQIRSLAAELQSITKDERMASTELLHTVPPTNPDRFLTKGIFQVDMHARHLTVKLEYIPLSPSNFDYFVTLIKHSPETVAYEQLVKESQGYELSRYEAKEMSRWRIHELRKVLEENPKSPKYIITIRGKGYRLVTE